jgi:hypothetical protein
MKFYELAVGAVFTVWGRTYRKTAMSMAEALDDGPRRGWGCVFFGETEVVSDGPLLPPEVAAKWKPERGHWTAVVEEMLRS